MTILTPTRGVSELARIGPDEVRERYGVPPGLVPDFIALRGDPSDGLPGAPGIGAKTAAELLRAHGSLEGVLAAAGVTEGPGAAAAAVRATGVMRPRIAASLRDLAWRPGAAIRLLGIPVP